MRAQKTTTRLPQWTARVSYSRPSSEPLLYVVQQLSKSRTQLVALTFVDARLLFRCGHLALECYQYINRPRPNLMLAKLLANYPLHTVAIHRKLEYPFRHGDRNASLAKRILAEFQAQLCAPEARAAIKQRDDLMLDQAVLAAKKITKAIAAAVLTDVSCFQRWRRHRRNAGEVLKNLAESGLRLNCNTRTAFGAPGIDYPTTADGFHANSKAVGFFAAGDGRLVGTFHDSSRLDAID